MYASSSSSTHLRRHIAARKSRGIPNERGQDEGELCKGREHIHDGDVACKKRRVGEHATPGGREGGEGEGRGAGRSGEIVPLSRQIAIAHETRSFIPYSARGARESRLDQPDSTRTE